MLLGEYDAAARQFSVIQGSRSRRLFAFLEGLFGESGSVLSTLKRFQRHELSPEHVRSVLKEELGDCLWYLTLTSSRLQSSLEDIGSLALVYASPRTPPQIEELDFRHLRNEIQRNLARFSTSESLVSAELAATVGNLMTGVFGARRSFRGRLPDIHLLLAKTLVFLVLVSIIHNIDLDEIAQVNLEKLRDRWPPPDGQNRSALFDTECPAHEQLPRDGTFTFLPEHQEANARVILQYNGVNVGDRLSDNRAFPDHYRFHDAFHIANAAVLGWSPVLRGLLRRKRRSDPSLDEIQDGQRAQLVEEVLTQFVFNHAEQRSLFYGVQHLELGLLKSVRELSRGYEVSKVRLWEWEDAISQGYTLFRHLRDNNGGQVSIDLAHRKAEFRPT